MAVETEGYQLDGEEKVGGCRSVAQRKGRQQAEGVMWGGEQAGGKGRPD